MINLLSTTANGSLADSKEMIKKAIKIAQEYAFSRLKIDWDIDILVTNKISMRVPENGVGGFTHRTDFIQITIDEKNATKILVAECLIHEFCHAARWDKNGEWMNSLFDALIFEGTAVYFENEFIKNKKEKQLFIKTVIERSDQENEKILEKLHDQLDSDVYDYHVIFFSGNDELPRWSGYSLGYYLVKKYLKKTGKTIEGAFADKYADFRIVYNTNIYR